MSRCSAGESNYGFDSDDDSVDGAIFQIPPQLMMSSLALPQALNPVLGDSPAFLFFRAVAVATVMIGGSAGCSRQLISREKIARESVIPHGVPSREKVVVVYTHCNNPTGLGDHTFAISLAYELYRAQQVPYPIVLLSGEDNGVARINTLCQTPTSGHKIYDLSVQAYAVEQFDSTRFNIMGYVELGCRENSESYVKEVMLRDGGKAVFVGRPVEHSDYKANYLQGYYPRLPSDRATTLLMGFGGNRDGVTYTPYSQVAGKVPSAELIMTRLPERLVSENPGYGLFCVSKGKSGAADIDYATDYLGAFDKRNRSHIVIALGDPGVISAAVSQFAHNAGKTVVFVDVLNRKTILYSPGSSPVFKENVDPNELTLEQTNQFYIFMSRGIPQVELRRLIENAGDFVGFSSATMAIEGLGAGKLVFYQLIKDPCNFLVDYLSVAGSDNTLLPFARLLFNASRLRSVEARQLQAFLSDPEICARMSAFNRSLMMGASERLPVAVLNALALPVKVSSLQPRLFRAANNSRGIGIAMDLLFAHYGENGTHRAAIQTLRDKLSGCSESEVREAAITEIAGLIKWGGGLGFKHANQALTYFHDTLKAGLPVDVAVLDKLQFLIEPQSAASALFC